MAGAIDLGMKSRLSRPKGWPLNDDWVPMGMYIYIYVYYTYISYMYIYIIYIYIQFQYDSTSMTTILSILWKCYFQIRLRSRTFSILWEIYGFFQIFKPKHWKIISRMLGSSGPRQRGMFSMLGAEFRNLSLTRARSSNRLTRATNSNRFKQTIAHQPSRSCQSIPPRLSRS